MKHLKFRTQLIIGFALIIVMSLLANVIAIFEMQNIKQSTHQILEHPFTVSNTAKDIKINVLAMHRTMKDLALAHNAGEIEIAINLIHKHDSLVRNSFNLITEKFLGDKNIILESYMVYNQWETIQNEVIELKTKGLTDEAIDITQSLGNAHVKLLTEKIDVLIDFAFNKADEYLINVNNKTNAAIKYIIALMLILIAISVIISFSVTKNIMSPIYRFITQIDEVLLKKQAFLSNKLVFDETAIFDYTITEIELAHNQILEQNKKLSLFNEKLEQEVALKTKELKEQNEEYLTQNEEYQALNEEYVTQNEQLKLANFELEEREIRLKEANAAKDKFFSIISHDLKSPFNAMLGFSELLIKNYHKYSDEKKLGLLQNLNNSINKTYNLLLDLLLWAKSQARGMKFNFETIKLTDIVDDIKQQIQSKLETKGITIVDDVKDDMVIYADKNSVQTILRNLVSNALKFSYPNGTIKIKAENYKHNEKVEMVKVSVIDQGVGIDASKIGTLFSIENTSITVGTDNETGTGLGLILCKEFVEKNNGKIGANSIPDKETVFWFTIPKVKNS